MLVATGTVIDHQQQLQTTSSSEGSPLLQPQPQENKIQKHFQRTGTIWTAMAHIITGVIGAGVLSLAWSIAQLGWIAGPIAVVAFAVVTLISTFLVCDCYRSLPPVIKKLPSSGDEDEQNYYLAVNSNDHDNSNSEEEVENGSVVDADDESLRNVSYVQAVNRYLGETQEKICGVIVQESLIGNGIAYTITAAVSIRAILQANCYHDKGEDATCSYDDTSFMVLFGAVQIVMSQIPDFHQMEWLSNIAAVMSFTYASIGCHWWKKDN